MGIFWWNFWVGAELLGIAAFVGSLVAFVHCVKRRAAAHEAKAHDLDGP